MAQEFFLVTGVLEAGEQDTVFVKGRVCVHTCTFMDDHAPIKQCEDEELFNESFPFQSVVFYHCLDGDILGVQLKCADVLEAGGLEFLVLSRRKKFPYQLPLLLAGYWIIPLSFQEFLITVEDRLASDEEAVLFVKSQCLWF